MIIGDLLDLVNKKKREKARVRATLKFVAGMGIAAAAGLARGILFAPKSGKETREELKKKALSTVATIKDTVKKNMETVKDSVTKNVETVKDSAEHLAKKLHEAVNP